MKKTRCPYCHSLRTRKKRKVTVEGGDFDQKRQCYEIEQTAREVVCLGCEKQFFILNSET
jgi:hypothetical protein